MHLEDRLTDRDALPANEVGLCHGETVDDRTVGRAEVDEAQPIRRYLERNVPARSRGICQAKLARRSLADQQA
jgi:hypothetical protein